MDQSGISVSKVNENVPLSKENRPPYLSKDFMMATEDFTPATFFDTFDDAFYFVVEPDDKGMDVDALRRTLSCSRGWIQNNSDKFLLLNDDDQFQAETLNSQEQSQPDCQFCMQFYNSSSEDERAGRAVMLYVNKDGKKKVACCSEQHEVHAQEIDPPSMIEEDRHRAIFYRVRLPLTSNTYMFESSLYPNKFLGFEPDEKNQCLNKLVLRHKRDELDTSCLELLVRPIK